MITNINKYKIYEAFNIESFEENLIRYIPNINNFIEIDKDMVICNIPYNEIYIDDLEKIIIIAKKYPKCKVAKLDNKKQEILIVFKGDIINENNNDILIINDDNTIEPINHNEWEIDKIVDILTDQETIKKLENNYSGKNIQNFNTPYRDVRNGDVIYITCMLKPKNNSLAYPVGQMGVLKCKILNTYYGLSILNQLKDKNRIISF